MGELSDAIDELRIQLAAEPEIFTDLCDILSPTLVPDGFGNVTETDTAIASDIPCSYRPRSSPSIQIISGGVTMTLDHAITLPFNDDTRAIEPSKRIRVQARENNDEIIFEQPTFLKDSLGPLVEVVAKVRDV